MFEALNMRLGTLCCLFYIIMCSVYAQESSLITNDWVASSTWDNVDKSFVLTTGYTVYGHLWRRLHLGMYKQAIINADSIKGLNLRGGGVGVIRGSRAGLGVNSGFVMSFLKDVNSLYECIMLNRFWVEASITKNSNLILSLINVRDMVNKQNIVVAGSIEFQIPGGALGMKMIQMFNKNTRVFSSGLTGGIRINIIPWVDIAIECADVCKDTNRFMLWVCYHSKTVSPVMMNTIYTFDFFQNYIGHKWMSDDSDRGVDAYASSMEEELAILEMDSRDIKLNIESCLEKFNTIYIDSDIVLDDFLLKIGYFDKNHYKVLITGEQTSGIKPSIFVNERIILKEHNDLWLQNVRVCAKSDVSLSLVSAYYSEDLYGWTQKLNIVFDNVEFVHKNNAPLSIFSAISGICVYIWNSASVIPCKWVFSQNAAIQMLFDGLKTNVLILGNSPYYIDENVPEYFGGLLLNNTVLLENGFNFSVGSVAFLLGRSIVKSGITLSTANPGNVVCGDGAYLFNVYAKNIGICVSDIDINVSRECKKGNLIYVDQSADKISVEFNNVRFNGDLVAYFGSTCNISIDNNYIISVVQDTLSADLFDKPSSVIFAVNDLCVVQPIKCCNTVQLESANNIVLMINNNIWNIGFIRGGVGTTKIICPKGLNASFDVCHGGIFHIHNVIIDGNAEVFAELASNSILSLRKVVFNKEMIIDVHPEFRRLVINDFELLSDNAFDTIASSCSMSGMFFINRNHVIDRTITVDGNILFWDGRTFLREDGVVIRGLLSMPTITPIFYNAAGTSPLFVIYNDISFCISGIRLSKQQAVLHGDYADLLIVGDNNYIDIGGLYSDQKVLIIAMTKYTIVSVQNRKIFLVGGDWDEECSLNSCVGDIIDCEILVSQPWDIPSVINFAHQSCDISDRYTWDTGMSNGLIMAGSKPVVNMKDGACIMLQDANLHVLNVALNNNICFELKDYSELNLNYAIMPNSLTIRLSDNSMIRLSKDALVCSVGSMDRLKYVWAQYIDVANIYVIVLSSLYVKESIDIAKKITFVGSQTGWFSTNKCHFTWQEFDNAKISSGNEEKPLFVLSDGGRLSFCNNIEIFCGAGGLLEACGAGWECDLIDVVCKGVLRVTVAAAYGKMCIIDPISLNKKNIQIIRDHWFNEYLDVDEYLFVSGAKVHAHTPLVVRGSNATIGGAEIIEGYNIRIHLCNSVSKDMFIPPVIYIKSITGLLNIETAVNKLVLKELSLVVAEESLTAISLSSKSANQICIRNITFSSINDTMPAKDRAYIIDNIIDDHSISMERVAFRLNNSIPIVLRSVIGAQDTIVNILYLLKDSIVQADNGCESYFVSLSSQSDFHMKIYVNSVLSVCEYHTLGLARVSGKGVVSLEGVSGESVSLAIKHNAFEDGGALLISHGGTGFVVQPVFDEIGWGPAFLSNTGVHISSKVYVLPHSIRCAPTLHVNVDSYILAIGRSPPIDCNGCFIYTNIQAPVCHKTIGIEGCATLEVNSALLFIGDQIGFFHENGAAVDVYIKGFQSVLCISADYNYSLNITAAFSSRIYLGSRSLLVWDQRELTCIPDTHYLLLGQDTIFRAGLVLSDKNLSICNKFVCKNLNGSEIKVSTIGHYTRSNIYMDAASAVNVFGHSKIALIGDVCVHIQGDSPWLVVHKDSALKLDLVSWNNSQKNTLPITAYGAVIVYNGKTHVYYVMDSEYLKEALQQPAVCSIYLGGSLYEIDVPIKITGRQTMMLAPHIITLSDVNEHISVSISVPYVYDSTSVRCVTPEACLQIHDNAYLKLCGDISVAHVFDAPVIIWDACGYGNSIALLDLRNWVTAYIPMYIEVAFGAVGSVLWDNTEALFFICSSLDWLAINAMISPFICNKTSVFLSGNMFDILHRISISNHTNIVGYASGRSIVDSYARSLRVSLSKVDYTSIQVMDKYAFVVHDHGRLSLEPGIEFASIPNQTVVIELQGESPILDITNLHNNTSFVVEIGDEGYCFYTDGYHKRAIAFVGKEESLIKACNNTDIDTIMLMRKIDISATIHLALYKSAISIVGYLCLGHNEFNVQFRSGGRDFVSQRGGLLNKGVAEPLFCLEADSLLRQFNIIGVDFFDNVGPIVLSQTYSGTSILLYDSRIFGSAHHNVLIDVQNASNVSVDINNVEISYVHGEIILCKVTFMSQHTGAMITTNFDNINIQNYAELAKIVGLCVSDICCIYPERIFCRARKIYARNFVHMRFSGIGIGELYYDTEDIFVVEAIRKQDAFHQRIDWKFINTRNTDLSIFLTSYSCGSVFEANNEKNTILLFNETKVCLPSVIYVNTNLAVIFDGGEVFFAPENFKFLQRSGDPNNIYIQNSKKICNIIMNKPFARLLMSGRYMSTEQLLIGIDIIGYNSSVNITDLRTSCNLIVRSVVYSSLYVLDAANKQYRNIMFLEGNDRQFWPVFQDGGWDIVLLSDLVWNRGIDLPRCGARSWQLNASRDIELLCGGVLSINPDSHISISMDNSLPYVINIASGQVVIGNGIHVSGVIRFICTGNDDIGIDVSKVESSFDLFLTIDNKTQGRVNLYLLDKTWAWKPVYIPPNVNSVCVYTSEELISVLENSGLEEKYICIMRDMDVANLVVANTVTIRSKQSSRDFRYILGDKIINMAVSELGGSAGVLYNNTEDPLFVLMSNSVLSLQGEFCTKRLLYAGPHAVNVLVNINNTTNIYREFEVECYASGYINVWNYGDSISLAFINKDSVTTQTFSNVGIGIITSDIIMLHDISHINGMILAGNYNLCSYDTRIQFNKNIRPVLQIVDSYLHTANNVDRVQLDWRNLNVAVSKSIFLDGYKCKYIVLNMHDVTFLWEHARKPLLCFTSALSDINISMSLSNIDNLSLESGALLECNMNSGNVTIEIQYLDGCCQSLSKPLQLFNMLCISNLIGCVNGGKGSSVSWCGQLSDVCHAYFILKDNQDMFLDVNNLPNQFDIRIDAAGRSVYLVSVDNFTELIHHLNNTSDTYMYGKDGILDICSPIHIVGKKAFGEPIACWKNDFQSVCIECCPSYISSMRFSDNAVISFSDSSPAAWVTGGFVRVYSDSVLNINLEHLSEIQCDSRSIATDMRFILQGVGGVYIDQTNGRVTISPVLSHTESTAWIITENRTLLLSGHVKLWSPIKVDGNVVIGSSCNLAIQDGSFYHLFCGSPDSNLILEVSGESPGLFMINNANSGCNIKLSGCMGITLNGKRLISNTRTGLIKCTINVDDCALTHNIHLTWQQCYNAMFESNRQAYYVGNDLSDIADTSMSELHWYLYSDCCVTRKTDISAVLSIYNGLIHMCIIPTKLGGIIVSESEVFADILSVNIYDILFINTGVLWLHDVRLAFSSNAGLNNNAGITHCGVGLYNSNIVSLSANKVCFGQFSTCNFRIYRDYALIDNILNVFSGPVDLSFVETCYLQSIPYNVLLCNTASLVVSDLVEVKGVWNIVMNADFNWNLDQSQERFVLLEKSDAASILFENRGEIRLCHDNSSLCLKHGTIGIKKEEAACAVLCTGLSVSCTLNDVKIYGGPHMVFMQNTGQMEVCFHDISCGSLHTLVAERPTDKGQKPSYYSFSRIRGENYHDRFALLFIENDIVDGLGVVCISDIESPLNMVYYIGVKSYICELSFTNVHAQCRIVCDMADKTTNGSLHIKILGQDTIVNIFNGVSTYLKSNNTTGDNYIFCSSNTDVIGAICVPANSSLQFGCVGDIQSLFPLYVGDSHVYVSVKTSAIPDSVLQAIRKNTLSFNMLSDSRLMLWGKYVGCIAISMESKTSLNLQNACFINRLDVWSNDSTNIKIEMKDVLCCLSHDIRASILSQYKTVFLFGNISVDNVVLLDHDMNFITNRTIHNLQLKSRNNTNVFFNNNLSGRGVTITYTSPCLLNVVAPRINIQMCGAWAFMNESVLNAYEFIVAYGAYNCLINFTEVELMSNIKIKTNNDTCVVHTDNGIMCVSPYIPAYTNMKNKTVDMLLNRTINLLEDCVIHQGTTINLFGGNTAKHAMKNGFQESYNIEFILNTDTSYAVLNLGVGKFVLSDGAGISFHNICIRASNEHNVLVSMLSYIRFSLSFYGIADMVPDNIYLECWGVGHFDILNTKHTRSWDNKERISLFALC